MANSGRNGLQAVFHRLVGARGVMNVAPAADANSPTSATTTTGSRWNSQQPPNTGFKTPNYGHIFTGNLAQREIARHRVVFMGEIHSRPPIIAFERAVASQMQEQEESAAADELDDENASTRCTLHIVLEHFSYEMQPLLDQFIIGELDFDGLCQAYREHGTEGHDLRPYRPLLEDARSSFSMPQHPRRRRIQLHAGFLSRIYARMLMKRGELVALQAAAQWLPPTDINNQRQQPLLQGTETHYRIFESLLTGRPYASLRLEQLSAVALEGDNLPDERFRKMFQAQLLKDVAMAHKVNQLLQPHKWNHNSSIKNDDKVLVIAGNGHVMHYCGVPERVLQEYPDLADETCVVISHNSFQGGVPATTDGSEQLLQDIQDVYGPAGSNPADYIYLYHDDYRNSDDEAEENASMAHSAVKLETQKAYDKVGESAHLPGNTAKAVAVMKALGYTDDQIQIAGPDAFNFQGVGNPHRLANIQPGETVLDVGCGLGVDSFIALEAATVAETPQQEGAVVVGIDISTKEVKHAQRRARERGLDGKQLQFIVGDMERIPLPDSCIDVVVSNGAFCLAPNKEKAFAELYRVLKPGGRISICTTTILKEQLAKGVAWPLCMQMFIPKQDLQPLCERLGFVGVYVDDTDSSMILELPIDVFEYGDNQKRNKVHVGSAEFSHLDDLDIDKLCGRVCVVAQKPKT